MNGPQNNQTELGFAQNAKVPIGIRKKKVITKEHRQKISHSLMGIERKPIIERFMSHVKISGTGCWEWFGCKKPGGYGVFSIKKNNIHKTYNAHRWSYQYYIGNIPEGLVIDHLCRVRHCVNPIHMELVTMRENLMRGTGFSARSNNKINCSKGHLLVDIPENRKKALKKTGARRYCPICYIENPLKWNRNNQERKNANNRKYRRLHADPNRKQRSSIYDEERRRINI